jgi:hypothetical protein
MHGIHPHHVAADYGGDVGKEKSPTSQRDETDRNIIKSRIRMGTSVYWTDDDTIFVLKPAELTWILSVGSECWESDLHCG